MLSLGLSLSLALSACASSSSAGASPPTGYLGPRVLDAQTYTTYAWIEYEIEPDSGAGAERRASLDARIRELVDRELQASGYQPAGEAAPSLWVDYHTAAEGEANFEVDAAPETYVLYKRGGVVAPPQSDRELSHGALIVDLIDGESMRLLWRGWGQQRLDELEGDPDEVSGRVDALILGVLDLLPTPT